MAKSFTEIMEDSLATITSNIFGSKPNRNGDSFDFSKDYYPKIDPDKDAYFSKIKLDKEVFIKDSLDRRDFEREYQGDWEGYKKESDRRRDDHLDALKMAMGAIEKPKAKPLAEASVQEIMEELKNRGVNLPNANPQPRNRIVVMGDSHVASSSSLPRIDISGISGELPVISANLGIPIEDLQKTPMSTLSRQLDALRTAMINSAAVPPMFIADSFGAMRTPENKEVKIKEVKIEESRRMTADEFADWCRIQDKDFEHPKEVDPME